MSHLQMYLKWRCKDVTPTNVLYNLKKKRGGVIDRGCRDVTPTNVLYNSKYKAWGSQGVTGESQGEWGSAEMSHLQMYSKIKKNGGRVTDGA